MSEPKAASNRRTVLLATGVAGGLAAGAAVLPGVARQAEPAKAEGPAAAPNSAGGYQLTEHVKRYYATTRV